jgi:hypothetical protein
LRFSLFPVMCDFAFFRAQHSGSKAYAEQVVAAVYAR